MPKLQEAIERITNKACVKNEYREQFIKDLRTLNEAAEALRNLAGFSNVPTRYNGDNDDVGECPYCHGWNMQHKDDCDVMVGRRLIQDQPDDWG